MINGQELIDRLRYARNRSRYASIGTKDDFESIQYLIPVIRKLKLDTTIDVVNAYLNNISGNGIYFGGETTGVCSSEVPEAPGPGCYFGCGWGGQGTYDYRHGIKRDVAAHGVTIPDELVCMARGYSLKYLLKLTDSIRNVQIKYLDAVETRVGEGIRVPVKFYNGLKQLREDLAALGSTGSSKYEWHKLFLKLKDARINIFPDVQEREWFNSAFARWSPTGEDVVTAHANCVGKSGSTYAMRRDYKHPNNINTVRMDVSSLSALRELTYIIFPGNLEYLERCNFDALADAMEILQYSISILCGISGAERLIDLESTAIYDKYSGSGKNLDESFYKLTPLAAILTAKCLSSSLYIDTSDTGGPQTWNVKLWQYFTVPGTTIHMPDNDIAIFIDHEIERQKDLVSTYIYQANKASKENGCDRCEREG